MAIALLFLLLLLPLLLLLLLQWRALKLIFIFLKNQTPGSLASLASVTASPEASERKGGREGVREGGQSPPNLHTTPILPAQNDQHSCHKPPFCKIGSCSSTRHSVTILTSPPPMPQRSSPHLHPCLTSVFRQDRECACDICHILLNPDVASPRGTLPPHECPEALSLLTISPSQQILI